MGCIPNDLTAQRHGIILVSSEQSEVLAMRDLVIEVYCGEIKATLNQDQADHHHVMSLAMTVGEA
jgi:ABC-type sugar transport system ATPase subunit